MLIKSQNLTWAGHAAHTEMKNANIRKIKWTLKRSFRPKKKKTPKNYI